MPERITAITGSTGMLGGLVAARLAESGVPQRLLVRDPARAPELAGADVVRFASYADRAGTSAALDGVSTLLMVSAAESADRLDQHRAFVESAATAGVRHIVYTSFLGASPSATFTLARDHFHTERAIIDAGLDYTFLRDSFYLDFLPFLVGEDGVIRGPADDGAVAAVSRADIARVAAAVLLDPAAHHNQTYDLTGREALTLAEVAAILTEQRGEPVRYHNESVAEAYESRAKYNAPSWEVDAWVSTYTSIAVGDMAVVSDAVERITGTPPETLREYLARTA